MSDLEEVESIPFGPKKPHPSHPRMEINSKNLIDSLDKKILSQKEHADKHVFSVRVKMQAGDNQYPLIEIFEGSDPENSPCNIRLDKKGFGYEDMEKNESQLAVRFNNKVNAADYQSNEPRTGPFGLQDDQANLKDEWDKQEKEINQAQNAEDHSRYLILRSTYSANVTWPYQERKTEEKERKTSYPIIKVSFNDQLGNPEGAIYIRGNGTTRFDSSLDSEKQEQKQENPEDLKAVAEIFNSKPFRDAFEKSFAASFKKNFEASFIKSFEKAILKSQESRDHQENPISRISIPKQEFSLKDAAGVPLKPYCRIRMDDVEGFDPDKNYYIKTQEVLGAIEESATWQEVFWSIQDRYHNGAALSFEKEPLENERESLENSNFYSHLEQSDHLEGMYYKISFIPGSNITGAKVLTIDSELKPILVVHADDPENGKYYEKTKLEEAMKKGNWNSATSTQNQSVLIPRDIKPGETPGGRMENLLHGLDPITVRPTGKTRNIYLQHHLLEKSNEYVGNERMIITTDRILLENTFEPSESNRSKTPKTPKSPQTGMER